MTVFLLLLLFAVQIVFNLYSNSAVQAAAFDAARLTAAEGADWSRAQDRAEAHVRNVLGRYGAERVDSVEVELDGDEVVLTVKAQNRSLLPLLLPDGLASDTVERSARVRIERTQDLPQ